MESGTKILLLPVLYTSLYAVYAVTVLDGTKSLFVITAEGGGGHFTVCIKCLFFDDEMCTLQKVGGEDSKGRRVL